MRVSISSALFHQIPICRNQKKGVLAKGVFAEIRRFFIALLCMYYMYCNMAPNVPTSDQPMFLGIVCLSSICCFKGGHVSWRAERKYSTAFDKSEKPFVQEQGCVCADCHVHPEETSCCATSFRPFPRLPATFRDFPPLSATFPPFAGAVEKSCYFPHNFRDFSATFCKFSKCSVHCMGVVALRSGACGAQLKRTR